MSDLRIAVHVDSGERAVDAGTTAGDLFAGDRDVVAARVNGVLRDLSHVVEEGDDVAPVALDSDDGRMIMRHSTAHIMAQAVQDLFPEAKLGIGPPIENGFYYDFDVAQPFRPEDLERIEQRMRKIVKEGQRFARREVSDDEARAELKDEPYKLQIIDQRSRASDEEAVEVGDGPLTIYDNLDARTGERRWRDLCRGPHVPSTRAVPAFKLLRSAGAYWRGRRTPSPSTSTCSRRSRSGTTAGSGSSSTCSRSRTRSAPAWPCSTPRAASCAGSWRSTRASGTRRPGTCS
jgi:threonyl-tRNA synthetase